MREAAYRSLPPCFCCCTLKHHYPVLEQHRWLTPLMEVRRWGKLVFCGGLKRSVRELRCNSATPRQQASETQSLLSVLNL